MSGIIFYKTKKLADTVKFYCELTDSEVWLNQGKCIILKHDNLLFGFCEGEKADTEGILTFFYNSQDSVDVIFEKLKDTATTKPKLNDKFNIYHFFATDPEGRTLEFQCFNHSLAPYMSTDTSLVTRRSIRRYKNIEIEAEVLAKIFELCRYAPTARNSEGYYYLVIKNQNVITTLGNVREGASKPIANARMAVAICVDTTKTKRFYEDGSIAAYHFILAAYQFGLGTCWIADMNRNEVKKLLQVPEEHYIACITPVGYPDEGKNIPDRRKAKDIFNIIE